MGYESLATTRLSRARQSQPGKNANNVLSLLRNDDRFTKLVKHLEKSRDLTDDLENSKNITFFAPTNQAFHNLEKFMSGPDQARNMREIIRYHILPTALLSFDWLYEGQLLSSKLKEKFLGGEFQKIRVQKRLGSVTLNHIAPIIEWDLKSENGIVHVLELVLLPPSPISKGIFMMPFIFSIFTSAMQMVGLTESLTTDKAITCFIPNNNAWNQLNPIDMTYLFTHTGSEDLQKIIEYHICKDLVYARDIMKNEIEMETYHQDQKLHVKAVERQLVNVKHGEENPERWIISVNHGEATIRSRGADFLSRNGNVYTISDVLIPAGVVLPSMKSTTVGEGRRRGGGGRGFE